MVFKTCETASCGSYSCSTSTATVAEFSLSAPSLLQQPGALPGKKLKLSVLVDRFCKKIFTI